MTLRGSIGAKKRIARLLNEAFPAKPIQAILWLMLRNPLCGNQPPAVLLAIGREQQLLTLVEKWIKSKKV